MLNVYIHIYLNNLIYCNILIHTMKDIYKQIILKHVGLILPAKRKPIHSSEYYLTNILDLVNDFNSWKSLKLSVHLKQNDPQHYKSIARIHRLWSRRGVYRKAFEEIRNLNINMDELKECDYVDLGNVYN